MRDSLLKKIHRQVKRFPHHTALVSKDLCLTYRELNLRANQVAHRILKQPEQTNNSVALLLNHDAPLIAALLGVLKAGLLYVPLSPSFPLDMLRHMVSDCGAFTIITDQVNLNLAKKLSAGKRHIVNLDHWQANVKQRNPRVGVSPFDHAYIIYTSGSSGLPKGVLHNHRNIMRMVKDYKSFLDIGPGSRASMLSTVAFSMSLIDIFPSLLSGAVLCMYDIAENGAGNLVQWLAKYNITHYQSTTTIFSYMLESVTTKLHLPALRVVKLGGEPVFRGHWQQFKTLFDSSCLFVNGYGLSEILVVSQYSVRSSVEHDFDQRLPVGFISPGCEVLLLDRDGKPAEPGVSGDLTGEIALRSDSLFLGYWGKPDLTERVLRAEPGTKKKIFYTGDLGRMNSDGCIHILGRNDFQVKIQGIRVELEAIEALLCSQPGVKQALVNAVEDGKGGKQLVAMVVPQPVNPPDMEVLSMTLLKKFPHTMVPPVIQLVSKLPRTPSVKLDRKTVGSVFYSCPNWFPEARLQVYSDTLPSNNDCWLVFTCQQQMPGLGEQLVNQLRSKGKRVAVVEMGEACTKSTGLHFTLRPDRNEDFEQLAINLNDELFRPDKVIYLWNLSPVREESEFMGPFTFQCGLYSLVFLVQAFANHWNSKLQIEMVTRSLFNITGEERLQPAGSLIMGPFHVIPLEYSWISCRCVDIDSPDSSGSEELMLQLIAEFETEAAGQLLAFRCGVRYRQTLQRFYPESGITGKQAPGCLRKGGVYLVTGGIGGIGLEIAAYLAKRVHARLVLTWRSEFPARNCWMEWLETHDSDDGVSVKIRKLLKIEEMGSVLVMQADVADREHMEAVVEHVKRRFGEINGVFHGAGVLTSERISAQTPDAMERIMLPWVTGLLNLEAVFATKNPLDFLVLCSSVTALSGGEGLVDYTAAYSFLDAWAQSCALRLDRRTISINWDTGPPGGMEKEFYENSGFPRGDRNRLNHGIQAPDASSVLDVILGAGVPQMVVSKRYFESPSDAGYMAAPFRLNQKYIAPRNYEEHMLAKIWQNVLRRENIGIRDHFFHLGGDSLKAATMFSQLEAVSSIPLVLGKLVESPTIEALAGILRQSNRASRRKYLVPVQSSSIKTPFFCVHPLNGNILRIAAFGGLLSPGRPFYAIQSTEPVDRVETMAANYLQEVREVQKRGPYLLGGRCFGAMVAFEMAKQLQAQGEEIQVLVILDGPFPQLHPDDLQYPPVTPTDILSGTNQQQLVQRTTHAHLRARFSYHSQPLKCEALLLVSRDSREKYEGKLFKGWCKAVDGTLIYHEIPCHHNSMLKEPHIRQVAAIFNEYLDRVPH